MYTKVIYSLLNPINRQNIYICMCLINAHFSKLSIISYVFVTSRLKSVFATTNVYLYLHASGSPHYEMKSVRSQQYLLRSKIAPHYIASLLNDVIASFYTIVRSI